MEAIAGVMFIGGALFALLLFLVVEVRLSRIQRYTKKQAALMEKFLELDWDARAASLERLTGIYKVLDARLAIPESIKRAS